MPQPRSVAASAAAHADDWRRADEQIRDAIRGVLRRTRGAARAVRRTVRETTTALEEATTAWATGDLRRIHRLGGQTAAQLLGIANIDDLLDAEVQAIVAQHLDEARAVTAALRRGAAGFAVPDGLPVLSPAEIRALTPGQLSDLIQHPIGLVRYRDGSYRTVADHGDMLIRTRASTAYNEGTLAVARETGSGLVVVRDGPGCGVTAHEDGSEANGQVWEVEFAGQHVLAHPRCQRSFHPLPPDTSRRQAGKVAASMAPLPWDAPLPPLGPQIAPRGRVPRRVGSRSPRQARRRRS